jgi:hypothetical protein
MQTDRRPADRGYLAFGVLVLVAGVVLLAAQAFRFELGEDAWPWLIVVPGLALVVTGLLSGREPGTGLCIAGSIVTTVGLVLLYQNTTGHWESWAYAWALVGPTAAGVGLALSGLANRDRVMAGTGARLILIGGTLFVAGLAFFEGIVGLNGRPSDLVSSGILPVILIGIGLLVVARGLFSANRGGHREDRGQAAT